jgi:hypothetical protein
MLAIAMSSTMTIRISFFSCLLIFADGCRLICLPDTTVVSL